MDDNLISPNEKHCAKKPKLHPADEYFANILEKNLNKGRNVEKKVEEDEDKLFCLSLYNEMKKVPESMRLKLKIDIYNLILEKQSAEGQQVGQMSNQHFNPYQSTLVRNQAPSSYYHQSSASHTGYTQYGYTSISHGSRPNQTPVLPPTPSPGYSTSGNCDPRSYSRGNYSQDYSASNVANQTLVLPRTPSPGSVLSPTPSSAYSTTDNSQESEIELFPLQ